MTLKNNRTADTCALLVAWILPTAITLPYFVFLAKLDSSIVLPAYGFGKVIQFGFPLFWFLVIQRRKLTFTKPRLGPLAVGSGFGALVLVAMLALYFLWLKPAGVFADLDEKAVEKIKAFGITRVWQYAALSVFYGLVHALMEEYYWRWFVFRESRRLWPLGIALAFSSLGFMAHHVVVLSVYFGNSPATYLFSLVVAAGGFFWALIYHRTGSLSAIWLSHLLVDAGIFAIGYDLARGSLS